MGVLGHRIIQMRQRQGVVRMPFVLQQFEGEGDILGGERRAVMKTCLLAQRKGVAVAVFGNRDTIGDEPIDRVRLVERPYHQ